MAREARRRSRPRPIPPNIELTDFDPFDPDSSRPLSAVSRATRRRAGALQPPARHLHPGPLRRRPRRCACRPRLSSADGVTYGKVRVPVLTDHGCTATHPGCASRLLPGFTRGALESWQPMVNHLARTLVADLLALSPADVVSTLAVPMPMGMIAHILGIGEEVQAPFRKWSNDTVRVADINISGSGLREIVPDTQGFPAHARILHRQAEQG